ncbi:Conserved_hypothetical protein [Hexamita inflata]|uniref:Uncharacterized protein n=1 Tax=Hexamita inflata TaxID=28002 RepID=A0AA86R5R9_9EUKA|nr:Conserved hypothetical protein [Hexamita inflata]
MIFSLSLQVAQICDETDFYRLSDFSDSVQELQTDLDFAGFAKFYPLQYSGIIDGKGHTIKNLLIDRTELQCQKGLDNSCEISVGIFSFSSFLHFHNIGFDNITIRYSNSNDEVTQLNVGLFVGKGHGIKLVNVSVKNSLVIATNSAKASISIGGLVGCIENALMVNNSEISVQLAINGNILSIAGGLAGSTKVIISILKQFFLFVVCVFLFDF